MAMPPMCTDPALTQHSAWQYLHCVIQVLHVEIFCMQGCAGIPQMHHGLIYITTPSTSTPRWPNRPVVQIRVHVPTRCSGSISPCHRVAHKHTRGAILNERILRDSQAADIAYHNFEAPETSPKPARNQPDPPETQKVWSASQPR